MDVFFDNFGCFFASRQKKVDVKMPVLDVFMTANSILLSNIHPTKHFWQIYIHCISAGCKNGNVPTKCVDIGMFLTRKEQGQ